MPELSKETVAKYLPIGLVEVMGGGTFVIRNPHDEFIFGGTSEEGYFYEWREDGDFAPQKAYGNEDRLLRAVSADWKSCG